MLMKNSAVIFVGVLFRHAIKFSWFRTKKILFEELSEQSFARKNKSQIGRASIEEIRG